MRHYKYKVVRVVGVVFIVIMNCNRRKPFHVLHCQCHSCDGEKTYDKRDLCMWTLKNLKISLSACAHAVDVQRETVCGVVWGVTNKFHDVSWSWLGWTSHEELDGLGMWHVWGRRATCIGFYWGNLKETKHLEDLDVDGELWLDSPCSG